MEIIAIILFFQFSISSSTKANASDLQRDLLEPKHQISFVTFSDINDNISMLEGSYNLNQGESVNVDFNKPYGLILMRSWKNILLEVRAFDKDTGKPGIIGPLREGKSKIGIYFGEYIGSVSVIALDTTYVSFAKIDFPEDCSYRYISNTITRKFTLKSSDYLNDTTFCYFNTAKLPITYTLNYSLGNDYLRILTNSDADVNATNKGYIDKKLSVPAFIKIVTGKDIKKNHYVSVRMSSVNEEKPVYKYSGFLNSKTPSYIVGETKHSKVSSSTIAALVVACIVFLALVIYAVVYLCTSRRRRHHQRHHHRNSNSRSARHSNSHDRNSQNNNININNNDANINNTTTNNNNNNDNPENHVEEKDVIENGRYKTPAHVNIELISSQFDQKYKSSTPNLFSRKSSSHFDNDQPTNEYDAEYNGYPLNEYQPPSKGILAPTSISNFSDVDDDVDDEYDEDHDLENVQEAPFKQNRSSSDDDS